MYFNWLAKKKTITKIKNKNVRHRTDFEADLWPKTIILFFQIQGNNLR